MKKYISFILTSLIVFIVFICFASAETVGNDFGGGSSRGAGAGGRESSRSAFNYGSIKNIDSEVDDCVYNSCLFLCMFNNNGNKTYVYYDFNKGYVFKGKALGGALTTYTYDPNKVEDDLLYHFESSAFEDLKQKGICPTNSYISQESAMGGAVSVTYLCYAKSGSYCSSLKKVHFSVPLPKTFDYSLMDLNNYFNDLVSNFDISIHSCDSYRKNEINFDYYINTFKRERLFNNDIPVFIANSDVFNDFLSVLSQKNDEIYNKCIAEINNDFSAGNITSDEKSSLLLKTSAAHSNLNNHINSYSAGINNPDNSDNPDNPSNSELDYDNLCSTSKEIRKVFKIISTIVLIAHWIVPFIIIVLGMVDYVRATLSSDEQATSKATSALLRRIIAGIIVFFIPAIMTGLLNVIDITNGIMEDNSFIVCTKCLFDNSKCQ